MKLKKEKKKISVENIYFKDLRFTRFSVLVRPGGNHSKKLFSLSVHGEQFRKRK